MTVSAIPLTPHAQVEHTAPLTAAVKDACKALPHRAVVPILSGLHLQLLGNGMLQVSAFDYETSISRRVPTTHVEGALDVVVPSGVFRTALMHLDQDDGVLLSHHPDDEHGYLFIVQGSKQVRLKLMDVGDYPALPKMPRGRAFTISGAQLEFIATKVTPFTTKEDTLPVLQAVKLSLNEAGGLTAWATDRYRAAEAQIKVRMASTKKPVDLLVPRMALIGTLFPKQPKVSVHVGANSAQHNDPWVFFHTDETTVTQWLHTVEDYPRLSHVFPTDFSTTVTVDQVPFLKALKFVSGPLTRGESVEVDVDNETVTLTTLVDGSPFTEELNGIQGYGDMQTRFNHKYLAEVMKVWGSGPVNLAFSHPHKPMQVTSPSFPHLRLVLMPVRKNQ